MKTILVALFMFVSLVSNAQTDVFPNLNPSEYLRKEFTDFDGNSIFRTYRSDGYIDLIITHGNHVNGRVHFYDPSTIEGLKVIFTQGYKLPTPNDFLRNGNSLVLKLSGEECQEFIKDEFLFEVMDNKEFETLSMEEDIFNLSVVYIKDSTVKTMFSGIVKEE